MSPHTQSFLNGLTLGLLPLARWFRGRIQAAKAKQPVLDKASAQQGIEDISDLVQEVKTLKKK